MSKQRVIHTKARLKPFLPDGIGATASPDELVAVTWPRDVWAGLAAILKHHEVCARAGQLVAFASNPEMRPSLLLELEADLVRTLRAELKIAAAPRDTALGVSGSSDIEERTTPQ